MGSALRILDPDRGLLLANFHERRDEPFEVAAARRVLGDLAEGCDRHRRAQFHPERHGRAVLANREPAAPPVGVVEGADVHAVARDRLRGDDSGDDVTRLGTGGCERSNSLELVDQRHGDQNTALMPRVDAKELFAPLGTSYDRVGAALSFGQDPLWRRFLVSRLPRGGHVLDVATGTGLVAAELVRRGFEVTGVDQSPEMLAVARRRFGDAVDLVEAAATSLPFPDSAFDHVTFTYLLRYVDDPEATLIELARVVRPGGTVASLEFGVPGGFARPLWEAYVRSVLPVAGRALRQGWAEVGDFLGGSIRAYWETYPIERQLDLWRTAGLRDVEVRRLSLGGGVVIWGLRE
jgi:demethylmenaquinone methyltransferase / 2-methoxy-6-polyprenyl-1,4-benzoquinol methylase